MPKLAVITRRALYEGLLATSIAAGYFALFGAPAETSLLDYVVLGVLGAGVLLLLTGVGGVFALGVRALIDRS